MADCGVIPNPAGYVLKGKFSTSIDAWGQTEERLPLIWRVNIVNWNPNALETHHDITNLFTIWTHAWSRVRPFDLSSVLNTPEYAPSAQSLPFPVASPCSPSLHHLSPQLSPLLSPPIPSSRGLFSGRKSCVANAWTTRYL